ncbi:hypothetical protein RHS04_06243 [Rhizoctonia solani]|uniref:Secreted protein n=1 Tax=Rhizoctonia solani TaxID=456999 RepID=A0A8H7H5T7_9AGAM|nr:hypothetical protein RHS04_06243 [Rhizoctonia solani]
MFYFSAVRLFTISSLIFSAAVLAAPMKPDAALVGRSGTCVVGCNTGTIMASRLMKLNEDLQPKYQELDTYRANGGDSSRVLRDIQDSIQAADSEISSLDEDLARLNNGKNEQIVNELARLVDESVIHLDSLVTGPSNALTGQVDKILILVEDILQKAPVGIGENVKELLEIVRERVKISGGKSLTNLRRVIKSFDLPGAGAPGTQE